MRWLLAAILLLMPVSAKGEKMATEDTKIYPLLVFPSYIKMIKSSVGSRIFRNLYYEIDGQPKDVLSNGNLSCAYFVGAILRHFGLISEWRTSVDGMIEEMKLAGWSKIEKPISGSVIVWEARVTRRNGKPHKHIGFYIGNSRVVSTSSGRGYPIIHGVKDGDRKVIAIFIHLSFPTPKASFGNPEIGDKK